MSIITAQTPNNLVANKSNSYLLEVDSYQGSLCSQGWC